MAPGAQPLVQPKLYRLDEHIGIAVKIMRYLWFHVKNFTDAMPDKGLHHAVAWDFGNLFNGSPMS